MVRDEAPTHSRTVCICNGVVLTDFVWRSDSYDTVANILRTHEIEDLAGDVRVPFSRMYNLRSDALTDRIDWSR